MREVRKDIGPLWGVGKAEGPSPHTVIRAIVELQNQKLGTH